MVEFSLSRLGTDCCLNRQVADRNNDPQLADFIESEFLAEQVKITSSFPPLFHVWANIFEDICVVLTDYGPYFFLLQVEAIKKISEYVAQLRRVGKGHGRCRGFLIGLILFPLLTAL